MNRSAIALFLSIVAVASAVKAQESNLPSFKNDEDQHASPVKDAVADHQTDFSQLIEMLTTSGDDTKIPLGIAQVVGLPEEMPAKSNLAVISQHGIDRDERECLVVYEPVENEGKRAVCVYLRRAKRLGHESQSRYYRVDLNGHLDKVVTLYNKRDDSGKLLPEGRSKTDDDIDSPEIKKSFAAEMSYWLRTQKKTHAKTMR